MYEMDLPAKHVEKALGRRPLIIIGDLEEDSLVLYSSENLPGYVRSGAAFTKRVGLDDPAIEANKADILTGHACVYPMMRTTMRPPAFKAEREVQDKPKEEPSRLLGVSGSFGYVPTGALIGYFFPDPVTGLAVFPSDISAAHEGAHVVSVKEIDSLFERYERLLSDDVLSDEVRLASFYEAIAILVERDYVRHHRPEWLGRYDAERSSDEEMHAEYREAFRLLREEPEALNEIAEKIRKINRNGRDP